MLESAEGAATSLSCVEWIGVAQLLPLLTVVLAAAA